MSSVTLSIATLWVKANSHQNNNFLSAGPTLAGCLIRITSIRIRTKKGQNDSFWPKEDLSPPTKPPSQTCHPQPANLPCATYPRAPKKGAPRCTPSPHPAKQSSSAPKTSTLKTSAPSSPGSSAIATPTPRQSLPASSSAVSTAGTTA